VTGGGKSGPAAVGWRDNVVRQDEFQRANPDAEVTYERGSGTDGRDWSGSLDLHGHRMTWHAPDLGTILTILEQAAARRESDLHMLGVLRLAWGDWFEDLRVEASADGELLWKGRARGGDGDGFTARSADGLNALFREALDRRERP